MYFYNKPTYKKRVQSANVYCIYKLSASDSGSSVRKRGFPRHLISFNQSNYQRAHRIVKAKCSMPLTENKTVVIFLQILLSTVFTTYSENCKYNN